MLVSKKKLITLSENKSIAEISELIDVPYSTVWYNLQKYDIRIPRKPKNQYPLFDTYTPKSCYWAGFVAADGNVLIGKKEYRTSLKLQKSDSEHLLKFKKAVGAKNKISCSNNSAYIQICSKQMYYSLRNNFNIVPNKSLVLQPPPEHIPRNFIKHYIRGYFDGDGHIEYCGGTTCNFNIVSGSEDMIYWFSNIFKSFGLISENHIYKRQTCFCIDMKNKNSLRILDWLYSDSDDTTVLDRKYYQYHSYKQSIQKVLNSYKSLGYRPPSGCKGFDLDYKAISQEYLSGKKLKELASKYNVSQWTLLDRFKKLGVRKNTRSTQT